MAQETCPTLTLTHLPDPDLIFGQTAEMREVRSKIEEAIGDDLPILIEGESGTGKEVVGRYVHLRSHRASGPFVRVNCGAMPARLLEGEMFGYGRAGDDSGQPGSGSICIAANGTLFLDEIGEMESTLQQKLLLAFKRGTFGQGKGERNLVVNARFICASSIDVERATQDTQFRQRMVPAFGHRVHLLPLRGRKQDIPGLCEYLVEKFARNFGRPAPRLSPYVLEFFQQWNWPGNIRELENWIARIVIFGTEEAIGLEFRRQIGAPELAVTRRHRSLRANVSRPRGPRRYS